MKSTKKPKSNYNEVLSHFETADAKLAELMKSIGPIPHNKPNDHFTALVESIISQQLSVKASDTIYNRLKSHCSADITPQKLARMTKEEMRVFGISNQKAGYLIDLAGHFVNDPTRFEHLGQKADEEVITALVEIKGIGLWTAQMFLMFTLGRPDVFAPGDLGLRNAMMKLYNWKQKPDVKKLERTAFKWKPYRTEACRYLWRSIDNKQ